MLSEVEASVNRVTSPFDCAQGDIKSVFEMAANNIRRFFMLLLFPFLFSCSYFEHADFEKTETGLMYKFHVKGEDTAHPKYGDIVRVIMAKRLNDSIFERTNEVSPDGIPQYLQKPVFKGAIEEGIIMMSVGDSATFLISTDSINKYFPTRDSTKNFAPHSYLAFDVKLIDIQTIEEAQQEREAKKNEFIRERKESESKELRVYIEDHHVNVKPSSTGLYYIETEKGTGKMPQDGDYVLVHYTGSFLDGTIFDSSVKRNQLFGFVVNDTTDKGMIPGWNEALKMMKMGSVATIIIPSSLAYDSIGYVNPKTGEYFIPPYSPLKFEIKLIDINPKK